MLFFKTNIRTDKITHPPPPKGKIQAKLNHMHTHNTHHTHKMCHSHSYTHTHTYTHKLSTNCLIHTHTHVHSQTVNKLSHSHTHTKCLSFTYMHTQTVNCLIHTHTHTHTQTVCHSHTATRTVCHNPYLTVQYMNVQIGRTTGIALCLCYLIMLCIPWTSSKQKHKL